MKRHSLLWAVIVALLSFICICQDHNQLPIVALRFKGPVVQEDEDENNQNDKSIGQATSSLFSSLKPYFLISPPSPIKELQEQQVTNLGIILQDGSCTLTSEAVDSQRSIEKSSTELAIVCLDLNKTNYQKEVDKFSNYGGGNLNQIHIIDSEYGIVESLIESMCKSFSCSNLRVLNLTGNSISNPPEVGILINTLSSLETLDLSNTTLKSMESLFVNVTSKGRPYTGFRKLKSLYLDLNQISELRFDYLFQTLPNIKVLSLSNNSILTSIVGNTAHTSKIRKLDTLKLGNSPLNCTRNIIWLMKMFLENDANRFPDADRIKCPTPEKFDEMTWRQRVSVLESPICNICDCKSLKKTAISVECRNKNLASLPESLPANTKILNLTGNQISSLVLPHYSKNWENVTYVYLENNLITSIKALPESNSKFMKNLAALDLRKNKLQEIPSYLLEQLVNLDQVYLSDNPWLCDCNTISFQGWLQRHFHKVADKEGIQCAISGNDKNGVRSSSIKQRLEAGVIYRLSNFELCPQPGGVPIDWLDVTIYSIVLATVLVITKTIVDYYYQKRTTRLPRFFKVNC